MTRCVLIVEDEQRSSYALVRALRHRGWRASFVRSMQEAQVLQHTADVILTDWSVGGAQIVDQALRPVVIYSEQVDLKLEGLTVVQKPAAIETIITALEGAIEKEET